MAVKQTNSEASAARVGAIGDDLAARAKSSPHSDALNDDIRNSTPAERVAIFDKMSSASPVKPLHLPDLKLTEDAAGVPKDKGKPDAAHDSQHDAKPDSKHDGKQTAKHDAGDSDAKHAGAKHGHLKSGKHPESHKINGLAKELPGSTNYTLREPDESHPGQIVERTYDKTGKLVPDAPVKVVDKGTDIIAEHRKT